MNGTDLATGKPLSGLDHLRQSIGVILSTPVGSRVMRRTFGSQLPALIDQPYHAATRVRLYAAIATALMRWEPRLTLASVSIDPGDAPGAFVVTLTGTTREPGADTATLSVPLQLTAGA
jgi:phage baseplate assembly protein W